MKAIIVNSKTNSVRVRNFSTDGFERSMTKNAVVTKQEIQSWRSEIATIMNKIDGAAGQNPGLERSLDRASSYLAKASGELHECINDIETGNF